MVADATLALLGQAADDRPLLLLVDDVQWLDRPSALVLGQAARRLAARGLAGPIGFLGAARSGSEGFFSHAGLSGHEVGPLGEAAAGGPGRGAFS